MGLDYHNIRLLAYTTTMEPQLDSIAMLGRQSLNANAASIKSVFEEFKIPHDDRDIRRIVEEGGGYSELLLIHLGFKTIHSFDFSDYESPTHVHDFNRPIPNELHGIYDLVLDGGSLEHIFNFPIALRNCMQMVRAGGLFVTATPCNNLCGHGFYQFSPELYFSLLRGNNGFELLDLFCHDTRAGSHWHRMVDPDQIKNRVTLLTWNEISMIVIARRTEAATLPEFQVQQSDYETMWAGESLGKASDRPGGPGFRARLRREAMRLIPAKLKLLVRDMIEPKRFSSGYFTNVDANKGHLAAIAHSTRNNNRGG